jgi:hypothetical protein
VSSLLQPQAKEQNNKKEPGGLSRKIFHIKVFIAAISSYE